MPRFETLESGLRKILGAKQKSLVVAVALGAGFLAGCNGDSPTAPAMAPVPPPTPPTQDSISLSSITPRAGTTLEAGQTVTFTATLNYTLASAPTGLIVVAIQDQDDSNLKPMGAPQSMLSVTRGTSTGTLTDSVTIPRSGVSRVNVFFALVPEETMTTNVVESVSYSVSQ